MKTRMLILFLLLILLPTIVTIQVGSNSSAEAQAQNATIAERIDGSRWLYISLGIAIAFTASGGLGYVLYRRHGEGTDYDQRPSIADQEWQYSPEQVIAIKPGPVESDIKKHGNQIM